MDKEPLISVIVPVYNVEKYLNKCVGSIISQTYRNLEIILIDDGSTDASGRICDGLSEQDKRIQVIHKENGGLSSARNAGLDIACGQFISFIDSDDYIDRSYIKDMYDRLSEDDSDIVISGYSGCDESGKVLDRFSNKNTTLNKKEFWDWVILGKRDGVLYGAVEAWSKLYKAELFKTLRFPDGIHEDEAILYELIDKCRKISVDDNTGYYYLKRSESITHKAYSVERMRAAEVFIQRSNDFFEAGHQQYAECTLMRAMEKIEEGIRNIPEDEPEKRNTLNRLLNDFRIVGKKLRSNTKSRNFRIKSFVFSLSPTLFSRLYKLYSRSQ